MRAVLLLLPLLAAPLAATQPLVWSQARGPFSGSPRPFNVGGGTVIAATDFPMDLWRASTSAIRSWTVSGGVGDAERPWSIVRTGSGVLLALAETEAYRSEDDGLTWTTRPLNVVFPSGGGVLVALPDRLYALAQGALYVSYDDGLTLQLAGASPLNDPRALSVAPDGALVAGGESVYATRDGGATWEEVDVGLPEGDVTALEAGRDRIFALVNGDLYQAYTPPAPAPPLPVTWMYVAAFFGGGDELAVADGGDRLYVAAGLRVYECADGGATWTHTTIPYGTAVSRLAAGGGGVLAGAWDGGLWARSHSVAPWALVGTPSCEVRNFDAVAVGGGTRLLTLCEDFGVFAAGDGGQRWTLLGHRLPDRSARLVGATSSGTLFVSEGPGPSGIYRSLDRGATWEPVFSSWWAQAFVRGPGDAFYVFPNRFDGDAWYRTTDEGETWTTGPIPIEPDAVAVLQSGRMVLSGRPPNGDHTAYLSDDGGLTWREAAEPPVPAPPPFGYRSDMEALAVGDDGAIYGVGDRVWRSLDDGERWTLVLDRTLGVYPPIAAGRPGTVVVADGREILYSLDRGETWASGGEVLPQQPWPDPDVVALHITEAGRVVAGVEAHGVYVGELRSSTVAGGDATVAPAASVRAGLAAWPNPASNLVTVAEPLDGAPLDGARPEGTAVEVLDALGRVVLSVATRSGLTEIDVSVLPEGVYFVRAGGEAVPITIVR